MRGAWCVVVAGAALAAGACKKTKAGAPDGFGGGPMGLPVEVAVARTDTVRDEIAATGQIEAVQSIDLHPEVDGRIVEILIREGQEVDKETPLFKVDDAQLQAQVAQLEAQRDLPAGPGARQGPGATECLVRCGLGESRGRGAERASTVRPAAHPARADDRAGAVRGRGGTALREPR